jgi:hypothetical protein
MHDVHDVCYFVVAAAAVAPVVAVALCTRLYKTQNMQ